MGRWDSSSDRLPALEVMNFCVHQSWRLKEDLKLSLLGGNLILFEFEYVSKAERVSILASSLFKGRSL